MYQFPKTNAVVMYHKYILAKNGKIIQFLAVYPETRKRLENEVQKTGLDVVSIFHRPEKYK